KVSGRSQNRGSLDWNAEIFHPPVVAGRTALRPEPGAGDILRSGCRAWSASEAPVWTDPETPPVQMSAL
ncbi:hypothetical protein JOB18_004359, partial [Solea senegalensis]